MNRILVCLGLVAAMCLGSVGMASPAFAMSTKVADLGDTPVPAAEEAGLRADFKNLTTCIFTTDARKNEFLLSAGYNELMKYYNGAFNAVSKNNLATFREDRTVYHSLAAPYKTQYGCTFDDYQPASLRSSN